MNKPDLFRLAKQKQYYVLTDVERRILRIRPEGDEAAQKWAQAWLAMAQSTDVDPGFESASAQLSSYLGWRWPQVSAWAQAYELDVIEVVVILLLSAQHPFIVSTLLNPRTQVWRCLEWQKIWHDLALHMYDHDETYVAAIGQLRKLMPRCFSVANCWEQLVSWWYPYALMTLVRSGPARWLGDRFAFKLPDQSSISEQVKQLGVVDAHLLLLWLEKDGAALDGYLVLGDDERARLLIWQALYRAPNLYLRLGPLWYVLSPGVSVQVHEPGMPLTSQADDVMLYLSTC